MRTTVTLADDVAAAVNQLRKERGAGISDVINELARRGLNTRGQTAVFVQTGSEMGAPALPLDDIGGLLDALEGDDRRS